MSTNIIKATSTAMVGKEKITIVDDELLVLAPAKINLSLLVAGKRPDGFHEIETIMAKVNWYDEILIQRGVRSGIELVCKGPYWAPQGRENLAYKACEMLLKSCGSKANIKITLTKNIPAGAGLGSASSDAAATLIGVRKFLQLPLQPQKLHETATALGSDVPFFLNGPLALCTGKGEKIKKLEKFFDFSALLILPNVSVSTKRVYANYKDNRAYYEKLRGQINSYIEKNRIDLVPRMCANMLEKSCFSLYREIAELKAEIESSESLLVCLSGSGSAMFCIIDNKDLEEVGEIQHNLQKKYGCNSLIVSNNRW
ncbi:MAG: 4-(cytidine 5'-diphospho)-2-C-methyl-D-erythritol kinase [Planctomycetota bacterium]|nr:MAG: 4-(cytidine 5'-diphospho)-2-C-methyl-D-erythritol kinase [Planctomycetota bacterium]